MAARQNFYAESLGESTTTSGTWQDKCTLTFTPDASSTSWVLGSWSHTDDTATNDERSETRLYHVEAADVIGIGEMRAHELTTPLDYVNHFIIGQLTFGASPGAQNVKIQYSRYGTSGTVRIKDARILIIKADAADQFVEEWGDQTTASTSYQTAATLTFTPGSSGDYLVIGFTRLGGDTNGSAAYAQLNYVTGAAVYGNQIWRTGTRTRSARWRRSTSPPHRRRSAWSSFLLDYDLTFVDKIEVLKRRKKDPSYKHHLVKIHGTSDDFPADRCKLLTTLESPAISSGTRKAAITSTWTRCWSTRVWRGGRRTSSSTTA